MTALRTIVAGLALALAAAPALAQTPGTLTLVGGGPTNLGNVSVGPYKGQINGPGAPVIDIYCVDYLHWATVGSTWNVNITNLASGNLSATRGGNAALAQYQQMAWLTTQYNGNDDQTRAIQTAIWNIMTSSAPEVDIAGTMYDTSYWMAQAASRYDDYDASFYAQFAVLTPANFANLTNGGPQEYLTRVTAVPEPGTYLLMASGLLGVAGVARVRRRRLPS